MEVKNFSLAELIERGGLYRDVKGNTPREVLSALIGALPPIPSITAEGLLKAVLEREALMSTSAGGGIALPHPRNPLAGSDAEQFVALAFPEHPIKWNSLDGKPVNTLMLIVSASAKQHLQTLSEITFFCREEAFCRMLRERAPKEDLLGLIREAEKNWEN